MTEQWAKAYAVLVLDVSLVGAPQVLGVSIFSKQHPNVGSGRRCLVVEEGIGHSYHQAREDLVSRLEHPIHAWLVPLMVER